jgi:hypothetical protein
MQTVYMRGDPHLSCYVLFIFIYLFHACSCMVTIFSHARRMGRYWCLFVLLIGYYLIVYCRQKRTKKQS